MVRSSVPAVKPCPLITVNLETPPYCLISFLGCRGSPSTKRYIYWLQGSKICKDVRICKYTHIRVCIHKAVLYFEFDSKECSIVCGEQKCVTPSVWCPFSWNGLAECWKLKFSNRYLICVITNNDMSVQKCSSWMEKICYYIAYCIIYRIRALDDKI